MRYREIGTTGIQASVVGLGTWAIGGGPYWGDNDDAQSVRTIRRAVEEGINLIDTAPAYGKGHGESVVGKALAGIRQKVCLATKCGLVWDEREGTYFFEQSGLTVKKNLSGESIRREAEDSLRRLGTDYIDIYFTHWQSVPPYFTPIEETMGTLLELKKEGKVRAIGVSNVTKEHVAEYLKYGQVDIVQEKYSMLDRAVETELLPLLRKEHITLQAYSPLEMGLLTGKIAKGFVPEKGSAREGKYWFEKERLSKVVDMLAGWKDLEQKYGATPTQLAIAWLASRQPDMNVLCGARKEFQLEDNVKGADLVLEEKDVRRMLNDIKCLETGHE